MENTDVHKGLTEAEIRDYLSRSLRECGITAIGDEKHIALIQNQIDKLQKELDACKKALSIETLIADKGWELHDISDHVAYDDNYMNFIGTTSEARERFPEL